LNKYRPVHFFFINKNMNTIDRTISKLPYIKGLIADDGVQKINKKYELFSSPSVTKDKQVQRLSVVNQYDNYRDSGESNINGGRIPNLYYHQLMSSVNSENKKRQS